MQAKPTYLWRSDLRIRLALLLSPASPSSWDACIDALSLEARRRTVSRHRRPKDADVRSTMRGCVQELVLVPLLDAIGVVEAPGWNRHSLRVSNRGISLALVYNEFITTTPVMALALPSVDSSVHQPQPPTILRTKP